MTVEQLNEETLERLLHLSDRGEPAPWHLMIEGRDHESGDAFIMVGNERDRREDVYVSRDSGPADQPTLDLIAEARNYLPILIVEVRRLRALLDRQ